MTVLTLDAKKFNLLAGRSKYTAEASTLGFQPGQVPQSFYLDHVLFELMITKENNGEVLSWVYRAQWGPLTIEIFND